MAWVSGVVAVIPQDTWRLVMRSVSQESGSGGSSPGCASSAAQSMVRPSSLGGVPVLRRASGNPKRSKARARPIAGASPTRPAGKRFSPIWISPRRNVPVVMIAAPQRIRWPSPVMIAASAPAWSSSNPSAPPAIIVRPGWSRSSACTASR